MNQLLMDRCRGYLLAHAREASTSRAKPPACAVTISRETGAGAVTIGQMVAELLEARKAGDPKYLWAVFDRNLVRTVLEAHKLPDILERHMPEDAENRIEDVLHDLLGTRPCAWTLVQHTNRTIFNLAVVGNAVLVGRGAHLVTADLKHVFHVRLVAPLEFRIRHTAEYYHLDREAAVDFVRKGDLARARYIRRNFGSRIQDPLQFHLVINTGRISFLQAARLIADAAGAAEVRASRE